MAGDTISCDNKMNERYRVGFSYCKKNPLQGSRKALYRYLVLKELGCLPHRCAVSVESSSSSLDIMMIDIFCWKICQWRNVLF